MSEEVDVLSPVGVKGPEYAWLVKLACAKDIRRLIESGILLESMISKSVAIKFFIKKYFELFSTITPPQHVSLCYIYIPLIHDITFGRTSPANIQDTSLVKRASVSQSRYPYQFITPSDVIILPNA